MSVLSLLPDHMDVESGGVGVEEAKHPSGVQGIGNIGNTCGINTLIQCIGHVSILRRLILKKGLSPRPIRGDVSIVSELQSILQTLWVHNKSIIPHRFVSTLHYVMGDLFPRGAQLDMGELWIFMMDVIERELGEDNPEWGERHPKLVLQMLSPHSDRNYIRLVDESETAWAKGIQKRVSSWALQSQGMLLYQMHCTSCGTRSNTYEHFSSLSVPLPSSEQTVGDCISHFFRDEYMNDWKCEKCGSKGGNKTCRIWRTPMMLCITLKRFTYGENGRLIKITRPVSVPHNLSLGKYCIGPYKLPRYILRGCGIHQGNINGGHYVAVCQCPDDDSWWLHDDLTIKRVDEDPGNTGRSNLETELAKSYMCFYEPVE